MKTIYLAGGCFWGVEKYFEQFDGVLNTEVGYANGNKEDPTYQEVRTQTTGFTETLKLDYDPEVLPLRKVLELYYDIIEPTVKDRQGHDVGNNYRTGIYYTDEADLPLIEEITAEEQKKYNEPVVTERLPLKNFYKAEEYHQKYLDKNPGGYCHIPKEKLFLKR
ncbi:MAG: peptide-methionine (S)-S-oxide reductase MsrA [Clostridiales bacterium]|nr:peptide-methionine (S)-S-oxide reductase MsrA [Clostridiales bacterium]